MDKKIHLPPGAVSEIRSMLDNGRKIEAIIRVRELSGAGLKEAKDFVDRLTQDASFGFEGFDQGPLKLSFEELMRHHEGEIRDLLRSKRKIEAVKRVRELTGTGLKEAKGFVDKIHKDMLL